MASISVSPTETHPDRFTSLPRELLHHIISFLPAVDFLRLSLTSKICRQICHSSPFLTFFIPPFIPQYYNYIYDFIDQRGIKKIKKISSWSLGRIDWDMPNRLLTYAALCHMENLEIKEGGQCDPEDIRLPPLLYCSKCLRLHTLSCPPSNEYGRHIWQFPSSIPFRSLQFLTLQDIWIYTSDFSEWVSSWQKIKKIELFEVRGCHKDGDFDIKSSVLEHLVIINSDFGNVSIDCERLESARIEITSGWWEIKSLQNISTPKLKYFTCFGSTIEQIVLKDLFLKLEKVEIEIFGERDLNLAKYMLDRGENLEEMTVFYFKSTVHGLDEEEKRYGKFEKTIEEFKKSYNNHIIVTGPSHKH